MGLRAHCLDRIVSRARAAEIFEIEVDHIIFKVGREGLDTWKRGAKTSPEKMISVNKLRI